MSKVFYHNAGLGDLIYCLPTVMAMGGGTLIYTKTKQEYEAMLPLMCIQDDIEAFKWGGDTCIPPGAIDLSRFREHPYSEDTHLINNHLEWFKQPPVVFNEWEDDHSFIHLPLPVTITQHLAETIKGNYAVINYTGRYADKFFNWYRELNWLQKRVQKIYFIGLEDDYKRFIKKYPFFNPSIYYHTKDLLEAAYIIDGAKYYTSCETVLLSIRMALGKPYRFQKNPLAKHCVTGMKRETIVNKYTWRIHLYLSLLKKHTIGYKKYNDGYKK